MDSSRALIASALFVIALAGVQLTLNVVGGGIGGDATTITPISGGAFEGSHVERGERSGDHFVTEDMAGWNCETMGNRRCAGPDQVFGTDDDPRPLKMVGVEVHKRDCAKGADVKLKLLKRSAIYGHCSDREAAKESGPREPREPSTSHGKK
jgi:hypothetical protein